jgi:hypothetical protein
MPPSRGRPRRRCTGRARGRVGQGRDAVPGGRRWRRRRRREPGPRVRAPSGAPAGRLQPGERGGLVPPRRAYQKRGPGRQLDARGRRPPRLRPALDKLRQQPLRHGRGGPVDTDAGPEQGAPDLPRGRRRGLGFAFACPPASAPPIPMPCRSPARRSGSRALLRDHAPCRSAGGTPFSGAWEGSPGRDAGACHSHGPRVPPRLGYGCPERFMLSRRRGKR